MTTYAARFRTELADTLGEKFTVTDTGHNLYAVEHVGGMSWPVYGPDRPDKRKPVHAADVLETLERIGATLRTKMTHFTAAAQAQAAAFLADLGDDYGRELNARAEALCNLQGTDPNDAPSWAEAARTCHFDPSLLATPRVHDDYVCPCPEEGCPLGVSTLNGLRPNAGCPVHGVPSEDAALDVWLRTEYVPERDDDECEAEANTYKTADGFRVDWSLAAVGLVKSRTFETYPEATAWLTAEGFQDFSS